jgi:hypothetical protein
MWSAFFESPDACERRWRARPAENDVVAAARNSPPAPSGFGDAVGPVDVSSLDPTEQRCTTAHDRTLPLSLAAAC